MRFPCGAWSRPYQWDLTDVQRVKRPRKPHRRPQPMWFRLF
jgi:hypothetical protein